MASFYSELHSNSATAPLLVAAGCLNLDLIAPLDALPERDARVMSRGFQRRLGGMAANVACAAAALGAPLALHAELIAPLAADAEGLWLENQLGARGVSGRWLDRSCEASSLCVILVEPGGERAIISEPSRLDYRQIERRLQADGDREAAAVLHVDGFHTPGASAYFAAARRAGWRVSIDLDELPPAHLNSGGVRALAAECDLIFCNRRSAAALCGVHDGGADVDGDVLAKALVPLSEQSGAALMLTLGAAGARAITPDTITEIPPHIVASVDTTGAGDVFAGTLLAGWLHGESIVAAARTAAVAAALSTTAHGAQGLLPDWAALQAARSGD